MRATRTRLFSIVAAATLAVSGMVMVGPGVAEAVTCPTVNPITGAVTPAPTPGVNWSYCDLEGARVSGASMSYANLTGTNLANADFSMADLSGANFYLAYLSGANFSSADLRDSNLYGVLTAPMGADFSNADVRGAVLMDAQLNFANFSGAYMFNAFLNNAQMFGANLSNADLTWADLRGTDLAGANLTNAKLDVVYLGVYEGSGGHDTYLTGATLTGASGCDIRGLSATLPIEYMIVDGCLTYRGPIHVSPFRNPVNSPPVVNVATAGETVAFRFTVTDDYGQPVTNLTEVTPAVKVRTYSPTARRDPIEWYSKGGLPLVNLGGGSYRYNFKTRLAWAGTSRTLTIDVGDGVQHLSRFEFLS